jgi:predicted DCC family thiol-disulfide oxidoreductase YuxK
VSQPRDDSPRPVLVFDGDCGFCRFWVARWRRRTGDRVRYQPFQDPDTAERFPQIPVERFVRAVHLVEPGGGSSSGARAVFRLLTLSPAPSNPVKEVGRLLLFAYDRLPLAARVSEAAYRVIADHRSLFGWLTTWLWGRVKEPSTYAVAAWAFRRLLALTYLVAFASLATQIIGLVGEDGIEPARTYLERVREFADQSEIGVDRFRRWPTLLWFHAGDRALQFLCLGGAGLAALLLVGLAPLAILPLLWLAYLSLFVVGAGFLSYQWDTLLLETGFLAIFVAPLAVRDRLSAAPDPPRSSRWLLWWLIVRLMVGSGAIKLASGDPTWRHLTALTFHFETQPIPTPVAWYAHQLPAWIDRSATAVMLGIELLAPLLIVLPRRPRALAAILLAGLQAAFAVTGNFAFFNLLSASLCVLLVDDAALGRLVRRRWLPAVDVKRLEGRGAGGWLRLAVACVVLPVSVLAFARSFGADLGGAPIVSRLEDLMAPARSVNTYGLFAVMTTTRTEIVIEGSDDGLTWSAYEFRYKPGDVGRPLPWVAPHQPRLDWQMWFAALGDWETEPWLHDFCARLLEGSPSVLRLVGDNPFQGRRPRYLRAVRYRYRFADAASGRRDWWAREPLDDYSPVLSLDSVQRDN